MKWYQDCPTSYRTHPKQSASRCWGASSSLQRVARFYRGFRWWCGVARHGGGPCGWKLEYLHRKQLSWWRGCISWNDQTRGKSGKPTLLCNREQGQKPDGRVGVRNYVMDAVIEQLEVEHTGWGLASNCCKTDNTKTAVLPIPDFAWQMTSVPRIAWGMHSCWTSEGCWKGLVNFFHANKVNYSSIPNLKSAVHNCT